MIFWLTSKKSKQHISWTLPNESVDSTAMETAVLELFSDLDIIQKRLSLVMDTGILSVEELTSETAEEESLSESSLGLEESSFPASVIKGFGFLFYH